MKSLLTVSAALVLAAVCLGGAEATLRAKSEQGGIKSQIGGRDKTSLPDAPTLVKSISLMKHTPYEYWEYDGLGTTYRGGNKLYFNYANTSADKPFYIVQIDLEDSAVEVLNLSDLYTYTVTPGGQVIVATEPYGRAATLYGYGSTNWTTKLDSPFLPKSDSPAALYSFDTVVGDDNNVQVFTYENSLGEFKTALIDTLTGAAISFSKYEWFEHAHFLGRDADQQALPPGTCFIKVQGVPSLFSYTKYWYIATFPNVSVTSHDSYQGDQGKFLGCGDVNPESSMCYYYITYNATTESNVNRLAIYNNNGLVKTFVTGSPQDIYSYNGRVNHKPLYNTAGNTLSIAAAKDLLVYDYTDGALISNTTFNAPDCSNYYEQSRATRAVWGDYIVSYTFDSCTGDGYSSDRSKNFTIYNYSSGAVLCTEKLDHWPHHGLRTLGDSGYFLAPSAEGQSNNHNRRNYEIRSFKTGQKVFESLGYAFQHLEEKNQFAIFYANSPDSHHVHDNQVLIYQYAS